MPIYMNRVALLFLLESEVGKQGPLWMRMRNMARRTQVAQLQRHWADARRTRRGHPLQGPGSPWAAIGWSEVTYNSLRQAHQLQQREAHAAPEGLQVGKHV